MVSAKLDDRFVAAWINAQKVDVESDEYDKYAWAADQLIDAIDDPGFLWNAVLAILRVDHSEQTLKSLGAGPLEDLIVNYGEEFIVVIEAEAKTNRNLRHAMTFTWLDEEESDYAQRYFSAAKVND